MGIFTKDPEKAAQRAIKGQILSFILTVNEAVTLRDGFVLNVLGQGRVPLPGATVTVDRGESRQRITASRVALIGIFALVAKKNVTQVYVTIEGGDGSAALLTTNVKNEAQARQFALTVQRLTAAA